MTTSLRSYDKFYLTQKHPITWRKAHMYTCKQAFRFIEKHLSLAASVPRAGCSAWQHQWVFYHPNSGECCSKLRNIKKKCKLREKKAYDSRQMLTTEVDLHSGTMFQQKCYTLLPAITRSIVKRSVLILIQSIHHCASLKKDLSTLHLQ